MCIAAVVHGRIPKDSLQNMLDANPHGCGFAWVRGGEVHWAKFLKPETRQIDKLLNKLPRPYLFHARLASVGEVSVDLCHPFPLTPDASTAASGKVAGKVGVMIHNGHWSGWESAAFACPPKAKGPWSDSRYMAQHVAKFGTRVLQWIPSTQKIAIMRTDKAGRPDPFIIGSGWQQDKAMNAWLSNSYWKPKPVTIKNSSTIPPAQWDAAMLPSVYQREHSRVTGWECVGGHMEKDETVETLIDAYERASESS